MATAPTSGGLSFLGGALGGLFSFIGARRANKRAAALARENRDWQERMSNTAYRRAVADMRAAGLNPVLALGRPASTPGGNVAPVLDEGSAATKGAVAMSAAVNQIKLMQAQARNLNAQSRFTDAQTQNVPKQGALIDKDIDYRTQQTINEGLREAGITTQNQILELERQIRALDVPRAENVAGLYMWLQSAEAGEVAAAAGRAGPLVLRLLQVWLAGQRGR